MTYVKRFFYSMVSVLALASLLSCQGGSAKVSKTKNHPVVVITTSLGSIEAELYEDQAPTTVSNFLAYAKDKFYDGTIFHRVIPGFMIQGGGFDAKMNQKETHAPIKNEAGNGIKNVEGTLAMARTGVVDSATAQFFINVANNAFLDHRDDSAQGYGYAVFGKVIKGMDVVHKIEHVQTATNGPFENVPVTTVTIESVRVKP